MQRGIEEVLCSLIKVSPYAEVAMRTAWRKWCQKPIYNQQDVSYKRFI